MFILLTILWFVREIKQVLFWLYLWQLKEYHTGRFVDHFRTHKGKKIIFNFVLPFKLVLFSFFLLTPHFFDYIFSILFFVYLGELLLFLKGFLSKSLKTPVKTFKIFFLGTIFFATIILFVSWAENLKPNLQLALILGFDILTPIIVSVITLLFQPFFVVVRRATLYRAKRKLGKIKSVTGLKIVAITGSYGKTSTKEFLLTILSQKYKVLATKDHQNSEMGIARRILNDLSAGQNFPQVFVAEVGAYNKGKVKEVCNVLRPQIGIVTGVNEQHMALFGSFENLISAEGGREMAESLSKNGTLLVNGENKHCLDLLKDVKNNVAKKIYGLSNEKINSDIWASEISVHKDRLSFLAIDKLGEMAHFDVKVLGAHNIQNLLGAILTAKELGMSFEEISQACKNIKPEQAGMVLKQSKHGINVIDSSYSANPDGVLADLNYLNIFEGKKAIVMPCLIELGEKSKEIHYKIGRKIGQVCNLAIITSKDRFKEIEKGFNESKSFNESQCLLCDRPHDIYSIVTLFCKSGDAVLLEGRIPQKVIEILVGGE